MSNMFSQSSSLGKQFYMVVSYLPHTPHAHAHTTSLTPGNALCSTSICKQVRPCWRQDPLGVRYLFLMKLFHSDIHLITRDVSLTEMTSLKQDIRKDQQQNNPLYAKLYAFSINKELWMAWLRWYLVIWRQNPISFKCQWLASYMSWPLTKEFLTPLNPSWP